MGYDNDGNNDGGGRPRQATMMAAARWVKMVMTMTMATKTAQWEAVRWDTTTMTMATVNDDDDDDGATLTTTTMARQRCQ
jgi:hypothetical protein